VFTINITHTGRLRSQLPAKKKKRRHFDIRMFLVACKEKKDILILECF
jgi:hypothetical protein